MFGLSKVRKRVRRSKMLTLTAIQKKNAFGAGEKSIPVTV